MTDFFHRAKAVIFDLDGVIINSEPLHMEILNKICTQYGPPISKETYHDSIVGKGEAEVCKRLIREYGVTASVSQIIEWYKQGITEYFETVEDPPVLPGIPELVRGLRDAGLLLGVASSSCKRNIRLSLKSAGLEPYFSTLASGEDAVRAKPAPDVYLNACEELGIRPCEAVAIEDSTPGVKAAKAAGLFTVGYRNPDSGAQDLSLADYVTDSFFKLAKAGGLAQPAGPLSGGRNI